MGLETLVLYLCVSGYECNYSIRAYYAGSKDLQEIAHNAEKLSNEYVPSYVVWTLAPAAAFASKQEAKIRLSEHYSLGLSQQEQRVILQWSY